MSFLTTKKLRKTSYNFSTKICLALIGNMFQEGEGDAVGENGGPAEREQHRGEGARPGAGLLLQGGRRRRGLPDAQQGAGQSGVVWGGTGATSWYGGV